MSYLGTPPTGRSYIGNGPIVSATRTVTEITATAGQTVFTANGGYTVGYLDVFVNGAQLQNTDFTATNGSTVTLSSAAQAGDDIRLVAWGTFNSANLNGAALVNSSVTPDKLSVQSQYTSFKNRIINGDMRIDQRNAGASVTPSTGTYTLDRWQGFSSVASKFTVQQNAGSVTPPTGFTNYLGVTSLSAYTVGSSEIMALQHIIEGFNIADLAWGTANAQPVTLSFLVRSSLTGTFGGAIRQGSGARSYPFSYTISAANTWEYKTVTIAGDTSGTYASNNTSGLILSFGLGVGSGFSGAAGSWSGSNFVSTTGATSVVGTNGATFYITGVQLEKGSTATSFDYRPYGTELALCQRYYQFANSAQAATLVGNETQVSTSLGVKVDMRAEPTVILIGGVAFHRPGVAFYNVSSVSGVPSATGGSYQTFTIASGAGGGTAGQIIGAIALSAEL